MWIFESDTRPGIARWGKVYAERMHAVLTQLKPMLSGSPPILLSGYLKVQAAFEAV
ncbi:hypothetical protein [Eikenella halliae]|uniref:hypothetical protein n=1 Tax=Eikenella halliae TaxID=1795832 RepID=UPI000B32360B|nr:hypothetical protein [Eikenella halliae]